MPDPNDSLVLDLAAENAPAVARLQRDCAQLALQPGWLSHPDAFLDTRGIAQHWNHHPPEPETGHAPSPPIAAPPGSHVARRTVTHRLRPQAYGSWLAVWKLIKRTVAMPELELVRVYLNAYPYGADAGAHQDSSHPDEVTVIVPVHEHWHRDWAGETVLFDEQGEVVRAVLPKPGRALVFRSNVLHAARPLARACPVLRRVVVFKCGAWPERTPIRSRTPDTLEHTFRPATHRAFSRARELTGSLRIAAAATWLSRTQAAHWPHGNTTFAAHLMATALYLQALGADEETILAGLAHAVFGTEFYRRRLLDPVRDRTLAADVFGECAVDLALTFACIDRKKLTKLNRRIAAGFPPAAVKLRRHRHAPVPGGKVKVAAADVERLILLHTANALTQMTDPTESAVCAALRNAES